MAVSIAGNFLLGSAAVGGTLLAGGMLRPARATPRVDLAKKEMPEKPVLCGTGSTFAFTA
jgi:hypothetical protein